MKQHITLGNLGFLSIGLFFGYIALGIFTDVRIEKLRPFVTHQAIQQGIVAGIEEYEKRQKEDMPVRRKKRIERDRLVVDYLGRLKNIMEVGE